jgi:hypothetical protein
VPIDRKDAADFDRDVAAIEAAKPPPRPRIDSYSLTMDDVTRVREPDPRALVERPPDKLGKLEAALGLALPADLWVPTGVMVSEGRTGDHAVLSFNASIFTGALNPFGGYIEDARSSWLESFRVRWSRGRAGCMEALARIGQGNFLVDASDGDAFTLAWYDKLPDRALPPAAGRARWLGELAASLASIDRIAELAAFVRSAPASVGIRIGSDTRWQVQLELAPRCPATEIVHALGWTDVAWMRRPGNDDVPYVIVPTRDEYPRPPTIGRWRLDVEFDGHLPDGPLFPDRRFLRSISAADRVRWISISPPA